MGAKGRLQPPTTPGGRAEERERAGGGGTSRGSRCSKHGLSSNTMALVASDCDESGAHAANTDCPPTQWPWLPRIAAPAPQHLEAAVAGMGPVHLRRRRDFCKLTPRSLLVPRQRSHALQLQSLWITPTAAVRHVECPRTRLFCPSSCGKHCNAADPAAAVG